MIVSASGLRGGPHSPQNALVVRDVLDYVECAGEIEDANTGNVAGIHLHEFYSDGRRLRA